MSLVIRSKVDQYAGGENGPQVRHTVVRAAEHSYASANNHLHKLLAAYKAGGMEIDAEQNGEVPNFF